MLRGLPHAKKKKKKKKKKNKKKKKKKKTGVEIQDEGIISTGQRKSKGGHLTNDPRLWEMGEETFPARIRLVRKSSGELGERRGQRAIALRR